MNDKLHCRENCRYHYSLLRELINNQVNKPNIIIRFFTQFMIYLCVAFIAIIIYNTYMIQEFVNDARFLNLTIGYIQQIRNYYKLTTSNHCNALYANKL